MKKGMKRLVSCLLAIAMVLTTFGVNTKTALAEERTMQNYVYNGYEVTFDVTDAWDGAFNAEVKIANTGDAEICDWALTFEFAHEIQNLWNATAVEHTGNTYVIKNADWNANIKPGEGVAFGMTVLCDGEIAFPENFSFVMKEESVTAQSYSAEFTLYSDWGTGCNGAIILSNLTDEPIENWQLEFDYDREIVDIANGVIVSHEQGHYVIKNAEYNADIVANSSVHISIVAGEGAAEERPENFTMQQTVVGDSAIDEEGGNEEKPDVPDSSETVSLHVLGKYNIETKKVEIEWFTNAKGGRFEILCSNDNVDYVVVDTVVGETTYQCFIEEESSTRFFKVAHIKDNENRIESVPFIVEATDEGCIIRHLDSDGDDIPDEFEKIYGTDVNNVDTDDDGLTDYQEIYCTDTDPTIFDSVKQGIADAQVDIDNDYLSNGEEVLAGTDPNKIDTDEDGLTDYEEIYVYKTNPIVVDSDGDTLMDGEDVALGLDPMNPTTYGVPDAEYVVEQTISAESEVLAEINTEENPYRLSVDIKAAGYVEGNLTAKKTGYAKAVESDYMVGVASELSYTYSEGIESVTISFEIDEECITSAIGLFPEEEELTGIRRFNVFKYFEDINMLLPIETDVDVENNRIYAVTDELGTYCVMDMELWLASFEVPEEAYQETPVLFSARTTLQDELLFEGDKRLNAISRVDIETDGVNTDISGTDETPVLFSTRAIAKKETPVDVVFLLQSAGISEYDFLLQKDMIDNVMGRIYNEYEDVRVCIIEYKENEATVAWSYNHPIWQPEEYYLGVALSKVEYTLTDEYCNRGAAFSRMNELEFRDNASKFVFHLANGNSGIQAGFFSELDVCAKNNINYTEILPIGFYYQDPDFDAMLREAIEKTGGLSLTYTDDTPAIVYEHIVTNVAPPQVEFNAIVPTGWKHIVLGGTLDPNNGVDTDNDTVSDWKEVDTERIRWETDGTVILPTIQDCIDFVEEPYAKDGLKRFSEGKMVPGMPTSDFLKYLDYVINKTNILPIYSDPTEVDSDGDGLLDGTAVYIGDKKIAPRDPKPLEMTGPEGIWLEHIEQEKNGIISTEYADEQPGLGVIVDKELADYVVKAALMLREPITYGGYVEEYVRPVILFVKEYCEGSTVIGAYLLNFIYDTDRIAYHSQIDTWQRNFGYNDFYDEMFRIGSYMHYEKFDFTAADTEYVLWMWKGDYWNMQSGAEIGLYVLQDDTNEIIDSETNHYDVVNFELPMTLSLYNYYGENSIDNLFNWEPTVEQWWITGFNPDFKEPRPSDMVVIGSVDFSEYEELFDGLRRDTERRESLSRYMIFDDDGHTVWVMWYKGVVA